MRSAQFNPSALWPELEAGDNSDSIGPVLSAREARRIREQEEAAQEAAEKALFKRHSDIIEEKLPEYIDKLMEGLPEELENCVRSSSLRIFGRDKFFEAAGLAHIPPIERERLLPLDKVKKIRAFDPFRRLRKRGYELGTYRDWSWSSDDIEEKCDWGITLLW